MPVKMFVSNTQVEDIAPRDERLHIVYEDCCKVGEIIYPQPSISSEISGIKISRAGKSELTESDYGMYKVSGKIIGGFDYFGYNVGILYLVIDAGFLIRAEIIYPVKHLIMKTDTGKRYVPLVLTSEDKPAKLEVGLGDYVTFESTRINAMWLDIWEGAVYIKFKGEIVDRTICEDKSMWIDVQPLNIEKHFELDSYYSKLPLSRILTWDERIEIEYPTKTREL